jgi:hypothetical protein
MLCKHIRCYIGFLVFFFSGFNLIKYYDNQVVIVLTHQFTVKMFTNY